MSTSFSSSQVLIYVAVHRWQQNLQMLFSSTDESKYWKIVNHLPPYKRYEQFKIATWKKTKVGVLNIPHFSKLLGCGLFTFWSFLLQSTGLEILLKWQLRFSYDRVCDCAVKKKTEGQKPNSRCKNEQFRTSLFSIKNNNTNIIKIWILLLYQDFYIVILNYVEE